MRNPWAEVSKILRSSGLNMHREWTKKKWIRLTKIPLENTLPASLTANLCCTSSSAKGALPCDAAGSFTLIDSCVASEISAVFAVLARSDVCCGRIAAAFPSSAVSCIFGVSSLMVNRFCSPFDAADKVGDGILGCGQRADSISEC